MKQLYHCQLKSLVIGIIGGMGPAATSLFFDRIVRSTPAKSDQGHLHIIVNNDPSIPDRTAAIKGCGPSPVPSIARSIKLLEQAGAEMLVMPCMTSHFFLPELRSHLTVPLLDGIAEIEKHIHYKKLKYQRIGVFATDGSLFGKVYEPLRGCCDLIFPDLEKQTLFMKAVYGQAGIKTIGPNREAAMMMQNLVAYMDDKGADAVIAGCTEMSVGLTGVEVPLPVIDPLTLLAEYVVRVAFHRGKMA